jgi:hypothetical protein
VRRGFTVNRLRLGYRTLSPLVPPVGTRCGGRTTQVHRRVLITIIQEGRQLAGPVPDTTALRMIPLHHNVTYLLPVRKTRCPEAPLRRPAAWRDWRNSNEPCLPLVRVPTNCLGPQRGLGLPASLHCAGVVAWGRAVQTEGLTTDNG